MLVKEASDSAVIGLKGLYNYILYDILFSTHIYSQTIDRVYPNSIGEIL